MNVCCIHMHVHDFLKPYVVLIGAVCVCISKSYLQILTPCWGERMYVYARICKYFREYTCIYVQHVYARIFNRNTDSAVTVQVASRNESSPMPSPVSALSLRGCYGKFVARQRKRRQVAQFNQIRSARPNSGSRRQLVQARPSCALKCHGNLGNSGAATFLRRCYDWIYIDSSRWNIQPRSNPRPLLRH